MKSSLFHPGRASEFPVDTLISAINSYMGFFYLQAREQLYSLYKSSISNPKSKIDVFGADLISTFERLDRCFVAGNRVL